MNELMRAIDMCRRGKIEYVIDGDIVVCTKKYFDEEVDNGKLIALEYRCNKLEGAILAIREIVNK